MQGDEVNLQPSCVMQFTDVPDLFLRIIVTLEDTWHAEFVGRTMMAMVFRERGDAGVGLRPGQCPSPGPS